MRSGNHPAEATKLGLMLREEYSEEELRGKGLAHAVKPRDRWLVDLLQEVNALLPEDSRLVFHVVRVTRSYTQEEKDAKYKHNRECFDDHGHNGNTLYDEVGHNLGRGLYTHAHNYAIRFLLSRSRLLNPYSLPFNFCSSLSRTARQ